MTKLPHIRTNWHDDDLADRIAMGRPLPDPPAVAAVLALVEELEEAHIRCSDEHHLFGEGRSLDQKRKAYRDVKQRLTDEIRELGER